MAKSHDFECLLQPSRCWAYLLCGFGVVTGVLFILMPFSLLNTLILLSFVLALTFVALKKQRRLNVFSGLTYRDGSWWIWRDIENRQPIECGVEYISQMFVILKALPKNQSRSSFISFDMNTIRLPVFRDSMNTEDFHRFQLLIRNT